MASTSFNDACVIFGDSITQTSAPGTYYQLISEYYERRLDVLNRGLSGYNTRLGLAALKRILAPKDQRRQEIRLLTIWFGANDATTPPSGQHVSLEDYQTNLREMIALLTSPSTVYYSPSTKIALITPPPFLEKMWRVQHVAWAIREGRATTEEEAVYGSERFSAVTQEYALACKDVAYEMGVECVDIHSGMTSAAGGSAESQLGKYYTDGLHLTPEGYDAVFSMVKETINTSLPELVPENMASCMPDYSDFVGTNEDELIARCQTQYKSSVKGLVELA